MGQVHRLDINITGMPGAYTATVTDEFLKVKPGHDIKWKVKEPGGFPRDAVVFLQFYENIEDQKVYASGCLVDGDKTNGRRPGKKNGANDHRVEGRTRLNAQGRFLYEISYSESGNDYLLLDPEIIVEGNPDPPAPVGDKVPKGAGRPTRPKKRGTAAPKKAAKKKAGKTSGTRKAGKKKAGKSQASKRRKTVKKSKKAKKTARRRAIKKR
jgi:hypothetical protein